MSRRHLARRALTAAKSACLGSEAGSAAQSKPKPKKKHPIHHKAKKPKPKPKPLTVAQRFTKIKHLVVIYEENHSFDHLCGGWKGVNRRPATPPANTTQVNQAGTP